MMILKSWAELKDGPGIWGYTEDSNEYTVTREDGPRCYFIGLDKSEYVTEGTDCKDFYDNYKSAIDSNSFIFDPRTDDDISEFYQLTVPKGNKAYFSSRGDNGGISNGQELLFNMTSSTSYKVKTVEFNEEVYIKQGIIEYTGAPLGAYIDIEIEHPINGIVQAFGRSVSILGSNIKYLEPNARDKLPTGLKIKVTVKNSTGIEEHDSASNFKVSGTIQTCRVNTV